MIINAGHWKGAVWGYKPDLGGSKSDAVETITPVRVHRDLQQAYVFSSVDVSLEKIAAVIRLTVRYTRLVTYCAVRILL
jgi:hypothetical protein